MPNMPVHLQTAPGKINTGNGVVTSKSHGAIAITVEPEMDLAPLSSSQPRHSMLKRNTTTGTPIISSPVDQLAVKLPTNMNRNSDRKTRKKSLSLTGEDQRRFVLQVRRMQSLV
jgi:hypothetical protein